MESVLRAVGQAASRAADHIEKNSSDGPRPFGSDRTEIGAPKIETGYYSTGKMQGFGSDDMRRLACGASRPVLVCAG